MSDRRECKFCGVYFDYDDDNGYHRCGFCSSTCQRMYAEREYAEKRQQEAEEREEERRRHEEFEEEERRAAEEYALAEKRASEQLKADIERNKKQLVVLSPDDMPDMDSKIHYKNWQDMHPNFKIYGNNGDWNGVSIEKLTYKLHSEAVEVSMVLLNNAKGPTGTIRITVEHEYADGSSEICGAYCANYNLDAKTQFTDNDIIIEYKPKKKKADDTRLRFCIYELSGKGKWVRLAKKAYKSNVEKQLDEKKKAEQEKRDAEARKKRQAEEAARQAAFRAEQDKLQSQSKRTDVCAKLVQIAALLVFTVFGVTSASSFLAFAASIAVGGFGLFWLVKHGGYHDQNFLIGCVPAAALAWFRDSNSKAFLAIFVAVFVITFILQKLKYRNAGAAFISFLLTLVSLVMAVLCLCAVWSFDSGRFVSSFLNKVIDGSSGIKKYVDLPSFSKSYTPEMDVIVGQTYTIGYDVNTKSGAIEPMKDVLFAKNGYIMGVSGNSASRTYSVDTATRTVTTKKTKKNPAWEIRYFKDGSGIYSTGDDNFCSAKDGAKFNAENATEVIGKTFSGKWSEKYTATVTFGKDGTAQVKFSDGDKGSGAYIASDEDNVVLYNHNNKGVWYRFSYSDTGDEAAFMRFAAEKKSNGTFKDSPRAYSFNDWKKK